MIPPIRQVSASVASGHESAGGMAEPREGRRARLKECDRGTGLV